MLFWAEELLKALILWPNTALHSLESSSALILVCMNRLSSSLDGLCHRSLRSWEVNYQVRWSWIGMQGVWEDKVISKLHSLQNSMQIVFLTILLFLFEMLFCQWLKNTRTEWFDQDWCFTAGFSNTSDLFLVLFFDCILLLCLDHLMWLMVIWRVS